MEINAISGVGESRLHVIPVSTRLQLGKLSLRDTRESHSMNQHGK